MRTSVVCLAHFAEELNISHLFLDHDWVAQVHVDDREGLFGARLEVNVLDVAE